MKEFNYQDYLTYQKLIKSIQKKEINKNQTHQPHDKIFKTILSQKNQIVNLLNRMLELKIKLKQNDIEKYNSNYINYEFKSKESDIVYKMKKKEVFFLIEHQSKIDYNMPKRILEYEVEIIKEVIQGKKLTKKNHKLPRVIPIVIYTGDRKWDVEKYIEECQEKLTEENRIKVGEYYVLDVNDYTKEELENDKLLLSKILLLEKVKTETELLKVLKNIIKNETNEENIKILKRIIIYLLKEKLSPESRKKLLKELESKEGEPVVLEVIRKENEKWLKKGIREGVKEGASKSLERIAIKMLQLGEKEEKIMKYIGLDKKQLNRIKEKNSKK